MNILCSIRNRNLVFSTENFSEMLFPVFFAFNSSTTNKVQKKNCMLLNVIPHYKTFIPKFILFLKNIFNPDCIRTFMWWSCGLRRRSEAS